MCVDNWGDVVGFLDPECLQEGGDRREDRGGGLLDQDLKGGKQRGPPENPVGAGGKHFNVVGIVKKTSGGGKLGDGHGKGNFFITTGRTAKSS